MTEVANQYLGNIQENAELSQRLTRETCLKVYLSQSDRVEGRIHVHTNSGVAVGIIKSRDFFLQEGNVFQTESGKLVSIHLQPEKLMVLSFSSSTADTLPAKLIHLGHVLGNHHWPIIVRKNKIYLQLTADTAVMEATIEDFQIPGLRIDYESRSALKDTPSDKAMPLGLSPIEHLDFSDHTHHPQS
ncbi:urease accessory protein UreE [Pleurocapsa sp. CCALA 161]|uniref:urease accessory protein UreE n=1 Tax=Pleurocapsa sp. CCALA 161 TaxID=2107688 RepID=UPI000D062E63|nr:urease accessory protein UreE [Pleurocapsa sp. CCALA 161]PSB06515.1 urease accessory protein UreE [Pleurocapsa sp. CCALA 161]